MRIAASCVSRWFVRCRCRSMLGEQWYFVAQTTIVAAPSDSNDGRDRFGFALATAAWTFSTLSLTQVGSFSGYSWVLGDSIYLSHAAITDGLYEIASRVDDDTITLVESISPADQTIILSSNGPWLTIQKVFTDLPGPFGNVARICDDGDYKPSSGLICSIQGDPRWGWYWMLGANTRGILDGSRATISATNLGGAVDLIEFTSGNYWEFQDLIFSGGSPVGGQDLVRGRLGGSRFNFVRCRFTGAGRHGLYHVDYRCGVEFVDCEIDACVGSGVDSGGITWNSNRFMRCSIHDNGGIGVRVSTHEAGTTTPAIIGCVIYDNASHGIQVERTGNSDIGIIIDACTIHGNSGSGIYVTAIGPYSPILISNCAIANNGGYGIDWNMPGASEIGPPRHVVGTLFHSNTSGAVSVDNIVLDSTNPRWANLFDFAPGFVSIIDGLEDYTPSVGSPLRAAGVGAPTR